MQFNLIWPGAPYDMSLNHLSGTLGLQLTKGRIINLGNSTDAKMGLGRILNVFSLQSIPRRLSLDFSDVVESGYSFDSMKGTFALKNGNAFTRDARFDGPVARVELNGRLGLGVKDYDMVL